MEHSGEHAKEIQECIQKQLGEDKAGEQQTMLNF
jgi:hypothetical protein